MRGISARSQHEVLSAVESAQVEVGADPEAPVLAAVARTVRERGQRRRDGSLD